MRITINAPRESGKGRFRLALALPLGIAKWKFIWRHLPEEARKYEDVASKSVQVLKDYRRQYGHWDLVEVYQQDEGTHVRIRI